MKVLHFFKTYWPDSFGGMERVIHALASGSRKYGIESEVLSLSVDPSPPALEFDGHRVLRAKRLANIASTGISIDALGLFRAAATRADLIHYHYPWPYMDVAHFLVRPDKPTVVTYQSDIVRQRVTGMLYAPLRDRFLGSVDAIAATTPAYVASSQVLRRFREKTCVIPLGLQEEDYPTPGDVLLAKWRSRFPRPFFLFCGEFRYYKGLDVLLNAARSIDADILLLGSGKMEHALRSQAASMNLANVHFLGRLDDADKAALLHLCMAVVFPSNRRSEAFGLTLVEASMFGRPMISCEIGTGTSYVNLDGITGTVVPPDDPVALAAAMSNMGGSESMRSTYGTNARLRYEKMFTAERMVRGYVDLYRSVASARGPLPAVS